MHALELAGPVLFLSTLSLRRATAHPVNVLVGVVISIHALLAESDWLELFLYYQDNRFLSTLSLRRATRDIANGQSQKHISIHALLAESDNKRFKAQMRNLLFLSTLSLRRATKVVEPGLANKLNFYPRSPCGERLYHNTIFLMIYQISIHALLAESDREHKQNDTAVLAISIHALLAESD